MASKRKIAVVARRAREKAAQKAKEKAKRKAIAEKKMKNKTFKKEIKEYLGFENLLSNLKAKHISINPCKEIPLPGFSPDGRILDWNEIEM